MRQLDGIKETRGDADQKTGALLKGERHLKATPHQQPEK